MPSRYNLLIENKLDVRFTQWHGLSFCSFPDILIGAPYFTHVKDEGRVYIYLNNGKVPET